MRSLTLMASILPLAMGVCAAADPPAPPVVARPDAFKTLVNPACSHCRDEAKRRAVELKAGDPIQVRFITGISSDAPGQFRAVVSQPVFDHATGLHILIPQGAHVVGSYDHTQQAQSPHRPKNGQLGERKVDAVSGS